MQYRPLGRTDTIISAIGLGCATFGREIDEDMSRRIMDDAVERGITFFDTAEAYGGGNARAYRLSQLEVDDVRETTGEMSSSECIIGRWLRDRGCHDRVTICTKVSTGNELENIDRAVRDSCERLNVSAIGMFMLHTPSATVPIGESLSALNDQVTRGRVTAIGCSNFSGTQLREALDASRVNKLARFQAIENIYNLADPSAGEDVFALCAEQGVSFITYSPLGAGFLTGKYTPDRNKLPSGTRFDVIPAHCDVYFNERGFAAVEKLRVKSQSLGLPMAYLAAAWATSSPHVTCTLFGARKCEHLVNGITAFEAEDKAALFGDWG